MPSSRFTIFWRLLLLSLVVSDVTPFSRPASLTPKSKLQGSPSDIEQMERQVIASARAQMDRNRVERSLMPSTTGGGSSTNNNGKDEDPQTKAVLASPWKVARAAAATASIMVALVTHGDKVLTVLTFAMVFVAANVDPIVDDSVAGPFARLLGRATIQSVETSKPKLRAVARAALADPVAQEERVTGLERRIQQLEAENAQLSRWKAFRTWVDDYQSKFALDDLKELARQNGLTVGGTKTQIMMRLLENGVKLGNVET